MTEERCKLILGDCLEELKKIPDKSIDLVLTDPPYGIGESMKNHKSRGKMVFGGGQSSMKSTDKDYGYSEWDKEKPNQKYFDEIFRISKNQIIFGGNYFGFPPSTCWLVWDKDNGNNDFADCELIWTSFESAVRKFKWKKQGMLQEDMSKKEDWIHPTQKPLALMEWIVKNYSKEGDLILDPFMGSGTTGVAALKLQRRFIGIEINKEYFDIAKKRIADWENQSRLFNISPKQEKAK